MHSPSPPPFLLLFYSIVMQEQTLSVCVRTVDKAAVLCSDFTRPGSWVAPTQVIMKGRFQLSDCVL